MDLWVQDQPGPQSKFQDGEGYTETLSQKNKRTKKIGEFASNLGLLLAAKRSATEPHLSSKSDRRKSCVGRLVILTGLTTQAKCFYLDFLAKATRIRFFSDPRMSHP